MTILSNFILRPILFLTKFVSSAIRRTKLKFQSAFRAFSQLHLLNPAVQTYVRPCGREWYERHLVVTSMRAHKYTKYKELKSKSMCTCNSFCSASVHAFSLVCVSFPLPSASCPFLAILFSKPLYFNILFLLPFESHFMRIKLTYFFNLLTSGRVSTTINVSIITSYFDLRFRQVFAYDSCTTPVSICYRTLIM